MNILKGIPELVKAEVITQESADRIREYYERKSGSSTNRLFIVFGILGAILVGLGIILIIAHNWDELSRGTKTAFAFLPLLAGQIACLYVLMKNPDSTAWREGGAAFLFFAVGASISLVSQIYHIPGGTGTFMLTWMLLCLPLIYLMKSSMTSLLYICGITYYATYLGYWSYPAADAYLYWLLLLGCLPHYYQLYRKNPESNFMIFHHWMIPLSVLVTLGTLSGDADEVLTLAYVSLLGLFYLTGNLDFFAQQKTRNNAYRIVGMLGTTGLLLGLSFDEYWEDLRNKNYHYLEIISTPEFLAALILSLCAGLVFYFLQRGKPLSTLKPLSPAFILFILIFLIGLTSPVAVVLINIYVLAIGILTVRDGARQNHLGILNFGLIVIAILVLCRFFDSDLSYVVRGLLFVSVGSAFFATNYWLLKKRKKHE